MITNVGAFLAISALIAVAPGPDTAITTRNALAGGRRAGLFTILGVSAGLVVWTLATGVGVAALLRASEPAFVALKVAGAVYLAALRGQRLWRVPLGTGTGADAVGAPEEYLSGDLGRLRDVVVTPDGELLVLTSNDDGDDVVAGVTLG